MESGLVNLRAELHKRRSEVKRLPTDTSKQKHKLKPFGAATTRPKPNQQNNNSKYPHFIKKKEQILEDKTEEILKLQKSKQVLEEKAALYDKIKSGTRVLEDDDLNQKYLVDFQEKIYEEVSHAKAGRERERKKTDDHVHDSDSYKAKNSSEEWVEYVDNFGRTRMCQRQDLVHLQQQELVKKGCGSKEHKKWEEMEQESMKKEKVHYQDVLFDEARTHGAGFMAFARDEGERLKQQQTLREVSEEAAMTRQEKDSARRKREKNLRGRLQKVRQRKRLKMGLPSKDMDELNTPPTSEDEPHSTLNPQQSDDAESSAVAAAAAAAAAATSGESHVREWDIGKPGVAAIMTQEQWIESRRKVRPNEFAPPTSHTYLIQGHTNHTNNKSIPMSKRNVPPFDPSRKEDQTERVLSNDGRERRNEIAPPMSYDYYNYVGRGAKTNNRSLGNKLDIEAAISKGISQLRYKNSRANT